MADRLKVEEAAPLLGMGNEMLRAWLRSKNPPPFGIYVRKPEASCGRYLIFRDRLLAYINATDLYVPDIYTTKARAEQQESSSTPHAVQSKV